jgi:hypothetical protein
VIPSLAPESSNRHQSYFEADSAAGKTADNHHTEQRGKICDPDILVAGTIECLG